MDDYIKSVEKKLDNKGVVKVKIIVENFKGWFVATANDEYGTLCTKRNWQKDKAIDKCKEDAADMLSGDCEFEIVELYETK